MIHLSLMFEFKSCLLYSTVRFDTYLLHSWQLIETSQKLNLQKTAIKQDPDAYFHFSSAYRFFSPKKHFNRLKRQAKGWVFNILEISTSRLVGKGEETIKHIF